MPDSQEADAPMQVVVYDTFFSDRRRQMRELFQLFQPGSGDMRRFREKAPIFGPYAQSSLYVKRE
jgi:hypothetical protein